MHGQMGALGPRISHVNEQIAGKLTLDVEVPLLHVRGGIIGQWRFVALPLHVYQGPVPAERPGDSARGKIAKDIPRGNSLHLGWEASRAETIDEELCGGVAPAVINRA